VFLGIGVRDPELALVIDLVDRRGIGDDFGDVARTRLELQAAAV
jgi:hypothetical protein